MVRTVENITVKRWKHDVSREATDAFLSKPSVVDDKLAPAIGKFSGMGIVMGSMIGFGIFVAPAGVLQGAGSVGLSLIIWLLCGLFSVMGAYCYAELATAIPYSGADYVYIYEAFGPMLAFARLSIESFIIRPACQALMALTVAEHILRPFYLDASPPQTPSIMLAVVCILLLTLVNCWDTDLSLALQNILTLLKVTALLFIIASSLLQWRTGTSASSGNTFANTKADPRDLSSAVFAALFAFNGWTYLNCVTAELDDRQKTFPSTGIVSCLLCTALYFLTNVAFFATLSPAEMIHSSSAIVLHAEMLYGPLTGLASAMVALFAVGALNGILLTSSRIIYAGARESQLPKLFHSVQMYRRTPVLAVVLSSAISLLYLSCGSLSTLVGYLSVVHWLLTGLTVFTLIWLRWKRPNLPRPTKVALIWPVLFVLVTLYLIILPIYEYLWENGKLNDVVAGAGLLILATVLLLYYMLVCRRTRPQCFNQLADDVTRFLQKSLLTH